jgi:uncharacterized protein
MEAMILKFVASARATGMRISTAEVIDCLSQLPSMDILDEAQFTTTLRANFAKSRLEQARFDHLYHLFFHELRENFDEAAVNSLEHIEKLKQELLASEPQTPAMDAIADFMAADPEAYLMLLTSIQSEGDTSANSPKGVGANFGGLIRRLPVFQAINRAQKMMESFLESNRDQLDRETLDEIKRQMKRRLELARRLLINIGPPDIALEEKKGATANVHGELGEQPFANLTAAELVLMRDVIEKLVRKLRDIVSLRYAVRSRGVPDIKKTLRAATRTQGIPMVMKFRHKPRRKGKILVLCDVSGSVWSSARFMLTMLYSLQDCFARVRSFVFIDEPVEVTRYFDDYEIDRALTEIYDSPDITYGAYTDYGRTLRLFRANHMDAVNKKTTVIVIGDGRTNYGNPEENILEEIRDRSRRLLWLNPESEQFWDTGDSEMHTYEVLCNEVRHCHNLNQLSAFFEDLML